MKKRFFQAASEKRPEKRGFPDALLLF